MPFLNHLPILGIALGILLLMLIIPNRKGFIQNVRAKRLLAGIILLNMHVQLDVLFYFQGFKDADWLGFSYLHYHLYGALFYLFAIRLFQLDYSAKIWKRLIAYTIIRTFIIFYIEAISNDSDIYIRKEYELFYLLDYYLAIGINLYFLTMAFRQLKAKYFAVKLSKEEQVIHNWLKNMLIASIMIYIAIFLTSSIAYINDNFAILQLQVESAIVSCFFFVLSYFAIRYPVFSIYGDFQELNVETKKKYANSSLKENHSKALWDTIQQHLVTQHAYRNPEFRLNDLAQTVGSSVHHVSQCINENQGVSFSDFINQFRVEEAKVLLLSDKSKEYTILAIAYEVGFNSKTAFYNAFKKQTGLTPSAFKRQKS